MAWEKEKNQPKYCLQPTPKAYSHLKGNVIGYITVSSYLEK